MNTWHLNPDAPSPTSPWTDYTRTPPPDGLGTLITNTRTALGMSDAEQLTGSAYHEAGHIIAYIRHGIPTGNAAFHGPGRGEARASVNLPPSSGPWEGYAIGAAAGHRAEIEWMRRAGLLTPTREWVAERHSDGDRRAATTVVEQCFGTPLTYGASGEHTDWTWMCDQADGVLAARWGAVERLADALVAHWGRGELVMTADAVTRLIEE